MLFVNLRGCYNRLVVGCPVNNKICFVVTRGHGRGSWLELFVDFFNIDGGCHK